MKYPGRDYQQEVHEKTLQNLSYNRNSAIVMTMRSGKSWNIARLAEIAYQNARRMIICAHTDILVYQMSESLLEHEIPHGIIKSGHYESRDYVQIASRSTLVKRLNKWNPEDVHLLAYDEGHLSKGNEYMTILSYFKKAKLLLYTGTLVRLDGSGFSDICDSLIVGPSKLELIKRGILVPTLTALPEAAMLSGLKSSGGDYTKKSSEDVLTKKYIHGDYVNHYFEFAPGRKGIIFSPTIKFADSVAENFNAAGVPTISISSKDGRHLIKQKLEDYYAGKYMLLSSVDLFIMGFFIREGSVTIQLRPTSSTMIYYQSLARCSMSDPENGKTDHMNIDCVNNIYNHTFPDLEPEWKLEGETKEERKKRVSESQENIVRCDFCRWPYDVVNAVKFNPVSRYFSEKPEDKPRWASKPDAIFCPHCGAPRETKGRVLRTIDGNLSLISLDDYQKYIAEQRWLAEEKWLEEQRIAEAKRIKKKRMKEAQTLDEMLVLEKEYGHAPGWAAKQLHFRRYSHAKHTAPKF